MKKAILILFVFPTFCFGQWTQVGNSINGQMAGDQCGYSTALSADGSVVAFGANTSDVGGNGSGQLRVFGDVNGTWTQIGAEINGETGGDQTGQSVSLSSDGSIVAVGEPFNNDLGYTSGQVRVFRNLANTWVQVGQDLYGDHASAAAGTTVDLSADGSVVAFGAPNTSVGGVPQFIGIVRVFMLQGNTWVQKGEDINGDGAVIKFGHRVSISADGNVIAVGQIGDPTDSDTGRVKIYQYIGNDWVQIGNTIVGSTFNDEFGYGLSLNSTGTILAVGTNGENLAKVFELVGGQWAQLGNTLFGENPNDFFGGSVSLSADGSLIAVGARFNSTNGTNRGRVYVFKNQGGIWTQINNAIDGVANGDLTGYSAAISTDGSRIVVGALSNDNNGIDAGQVRLFENSSLSISEGVNSSFSLYPNPTKNSLNVSSENTIEKICICNLIGQEVFSEEINSNETTIDVGSFSNGTYFVKINSNGTSISYKLLKI